MKETKDLISDGTGLFIPSQPRIGSASLCFAMGGW